MHSSHAHATDEHPRNIPDAPCDTLRAAPVCAVATAAAAPPPRPHRAQSTAEGPRCRAHRSRTHGPAHQPRAPACNHPAADPAPPRPVRRRARPPQRLPPPPRSLCVAPHKHPAAGPPLAPPGCHPRRCPPPPHAPPPTPSARAEARGPPQPRRRRTCVRCAGASTQHDEGSRQARGREGLESAGAPRHGQSFEGHAVEGRAAARVVETMRSSQACGAQCRRAIVRESHERYVQRGCVCRGSRSAQAQCGCCACAVAARRAPSEICESGWAAMHRRTWKE